MPPSSNLRRRPQVHVELTILPPDDHKVERKIVEPTPEVQDIYNKIRRGLERQANQNLLHPPTTPHSSRSPTDESYNSRSPDHLPANGLDNANHDPTSQGTADSGGARARGRRNGPLALETRIKTAFKRKTDLICDQHRAKKTTCLCFDLTKLEAAYESSERSRARSRSVSLVDARVPVSTPDGASYVGDIGTFGTGGAALMPSPRYNEMNELDNPIGLTTAIRPSIQSTLNFDLNSLASITAMTQAPIEQPFYPGVPTSWDQGGLFPIGSEMPGYSIRWQCEYKSSTDTESDASSESCGWTGPYRELCAHFRISHHDFKMTPMPYWSKCTYCTAMKSDWVHGIRCAADNCSSVEWQRWLYGSAVEEPSLESFPTFTQSGASEGGFSWTLSPPWNYPNSGGTEPSSWYGSYTGGSSYYEHSSNGENMSEVHDNGLSPYNSRPNSLRSLLRVHTARCNRKRGATHLDTGLCSRVSPSTPPGCRILAGLSRCVKSPWQQCIPIVAPLMATIIRDGCYLTFGKRTAYSLTTELCVVRWWSLIMVVLGFLATWTFKNGTRSRELNEESDTRYQVFEDVGAPLCIV